MFAIIIDLNNCYYSCQRPFDIQTRLVGHSALCRMAMNRLPRLCAILNKRILERRLNFKNLKQCEKIYRICSKCDIFRI